MNLPRVISLLLVVAILEGGEVAARQPVVLNRAIIIDGNGRRPIPGGSIIVRGKTIEAVGFRTEVVRNGSRVSVVQTPKGPIDVPPDAIAYDLENMYVMPGLIDLNLRYSSTRDLEQLLAWGVTTGCVLVSSTENVRKVTQRTKRSAVAAPQLVAAAATLMAGERSWWGANPDPAVTGIRLPRTRSAVRQFVQEARRRGISRLMVIYDDLRWCRDTIVSDRRIDSAGMRMVISEARRQKLSVEVHVTSSIEAEHVLQSGFSGYANSILDGSLDSQFVSTMNVRGLQYTPTLSVFEMLADCQGYIRRAVADQNFREVLPQDATQLTALLRCGECRNAGFIRSHLTTAEGNLKKLVAGGVRVALGTDIPGLPGIAVHLEMEAMLQAGLTPMQVIQIATRNAAEVLGIDSAVGTLEAGKQADLLVLRQNPLLDIRFSRTVWKIMKQGVFYDHQELIQESRS